MRPWRNWMKHVVSYPTASHHSKTVFHVGYMNCKPVHHKMWHATKRCIAKWKRYIVSVFSRYVWPPLSRFMHLSLRCRRAPESWEPMKTSCWVNFTAPPTLLCRICLSEPVASHPFPVASAHGVPHYETQDELSPWTNQAGCYNGKNRVRAVSAKPYKTTEILKMYWNMLPGKWMCNLLSLKPGASQYDTSNARADCISQSCEKYPVNINHLLTWFSKVWTKMPL